jgi:hypothetical protein
MMKRALWAVACASARTTSPGEVREEQAVQASCRETHLAWGTSVGLTAGGPEYLARGPQAVAVAADGTLRLLDNVNGRILALAADGSTRVLVADVAHDAEDLVIGSDGALAVYSPLQSRAWIFDADGAPAGSVAIDRSIRGITGITLGASRQVLVRTAYQETLVAGSPAAPVELATMLAGKREGAFVLPDGRGLATRATDAGVQLAVVTNSVGRRSTTRAAHALTTPASAAQLVGVNGDLACMRTEQVTQPAEALAVARHVVCMNATTGSVALDRPLAAPGFYRPAHELAVGGLTPRVAMLEPTADALVVRTCEVSR